MERLEEWRVRVEGKGRDECKDRRERDKELKMTLGSKSWMSLFVHVFIHSFIRHSFS